MVDMVCRFPIAAGLIHPLLRGYLGISSCRPLREPPISYMETVDLFGTKGLVSFKSTDEDDIWGHLADCRTHTLIYTVASGVFIVICKNHFDTYVSKLVILEVVSTKEGGGGEEVNPLVFSVHKYI